MPDQRTQLLILRGHATTRTRASGGVAILLAAGVIGIGVSVLEDGVAIAAPSATSARTALVEVRSAVIEVQGQPTERPAINIGRVILAEPASETALPIQVGPLEAIPRNSFIRIRGLPISAKLSEGHLITPGAWAVPLSSLAKLRLLAPVASSGRTELSVALVHVDGGVLAEAKASLVVAPSWLLGSSGQRPAGQRPPAPGDRRSRAAPPASAPPSFRFGAARAAGT